VLWSDIPNKPHHALDEESGATVFRKPSNFATATRRDRQGRLLHLRARHAPHLAHRVDGTITTVADKYDGKPLNSPNDIVCKSDGSIWFTGSAVWHFSATTRATSPSLSCRRTSIASTARAARWP